MSEPGYKVLLEKAAKVRKWGDNQTYRERFRKVISKSVSPEKLFSSLPETYSDSAEVHRATITNFMFPPERQAISKHDRLQAAYCLLTILHDKIYEYNSWVTPISVDIWSLDAEWIEALWEQMKKSSEAIASGDAEFFDKIDFALKLVEADLSQTPAEIEPQAEDMIIATIKKISKIIEKLETLKTAKKKYSKASLQFRWDRDDLRDSLWAELCQRLVDEIEIDLVEHRDCILKNTEWNKAGIENAIRTRDPDRMKQLIQEFKLIQRRLEIKSQQYREGTETGRNTTPAKEPSKERGKAEAGTQGYPGPRRQVPTSDADRQRAYLNGYTVGDYKYAPDLPKRHSHKTYPVQSVATKGGQQQTETEADTTPAKRGMFKRITVWIFKKTWRLIGAIIVAIIGSLIAAVVIRYFW